MRRIRTKEMAAIAEERRRAVLEGDVDAALTADQRATELAQLSLEWFEEELKARMKGEIE